MPLISRVVHPARLPAQTPPLRPRLTQQAQPPLPTRLRPQVARLLLVHLHVLVIEAALNGLGFLLATP